MTSQTTIISSKDITDNEKLTGLISSANDKQGVNPSHFLEFMSTAIKTKPWKENNITFKEWVVNDYSEGGIGYELDTFKKLIEFEHKNESFDDELHDELFNMRVRVSKELKEVALKVK